MPVYLGIPLTIDEAIRILGLNKESIIDKIKEAFIQDVINKYLKESTDIQIYTTDKGQFIIGYEIKEPSNVWQKFINVDEFIINIINLKTKFGSEMNLINADLTNVKLEYMEGEPEIVNNPIPYIIEYQYN